MDKNFKWDKNKITKIYILHEKNNINNIKYVGKTTSDLKKRLNQHISSTKLKIKRNNILTYKEKWLISINFNVDIKFIKEEINWDKAEELEKFYIKMYKEKGLKLTNCTIGGDGATPKYSSDNNNAKKTLQYDLDGNFIAEYNSRKEAEFATGVKSELISGCCTTKRIQSAGNFIWKNYIENYPFKIEPLSEVRKIGKENVILKFGKKIYQYSLEGFFINEYDSLRELERKTGYLRQSIAYAIKYNTNTYGYIWKTKKE
jgi:hypothetical protein